MFKWVHLIQIEWQFNSQVEEKSLKFTSQRTTIMIINNNAKTISIFPHNFPDLNFRGLSEIDWDGTKSGEELMVV